MAEQPRRILRSIILFPAFLAAAESSSLRLNNTLSFGKVERDSVKLQGRVTGLGSIGNFMETTGKTKNPVFEYDLPVPIFKAQPDWEIYVPIPIYTPHPGLFDPATWDMDAPVPATQSYYDSIGLPGRSTLLGGMTGNSISDLLKFPAVKSIVEFTNQLVYTLFPQMKPKIGTMRMKNTQKDEDDFDTDVKYYRGVSYSDFK